MTSRRAGHPNDRAITCNTCHRKFFPASLRFHAPKCVERMQYVDFPCESCGLMIQRRDMDNHLRRCRRTTQPGGSGGGAAAVTSGARATAGSVPIHLRETDDSGRVPCGVCGRKFTADRIGVHERVCKNSAQKSQARAAAQARDRRVGTQPPRRPTPPKYSQMAETEPRSQQTQARRQPVSAEAAPALCRPKSGARRSGAHRTSWSAGPESAQLTERGDNKARDPWTDPWSATFDSDNFDAAPPDREAAWEAAWSHTGGATSGNVGMVDVFHMTTYPAELRPVTPDGRHEAGLRRWPAVNTDTGSASDDSSTDAEAPRFGSSTREEAEVFGPRLAAVEQLVRILQTENAELRRRLTELELRDKFSAARRTSDSGNRTSPIGQPIQSNTAGRTPHPPPSEQRRGTIRPNASHSDTRPPPGHLPVHNVH